MNVDFRKCIINRLSIKLPDVQRIIIIRIITLLVILFKTTAFMAILKSSGSDKLIWKNVNYDFILVHLVFITLLFSFGYLFSKNRQVKFYVILNVAYTVMLIVDLWYFRVNRDFMGLRNIFFPGTFNPLEQSIFRPELVDIIFVIDLVLMIFWVRAKSITSRQNKSIIKFGTAFALSLAGIMVSYYLFDVKEIADWNQRLFKVGWLTASSVVVPGPVGHHGFEAYRTLTKVLHASDRDEVEEIKNWLTQNREQLQDNEYKGMLKGKNVIFLQLESFENFILNREVNGKEITPYLNKLTKEGLYFNNIYEQNNAGNSIDCDLMANTSILPLGELSTALNYGEVVYSKSLPRLLKSEGYTTVSSHAEDPGDFNWTELHKNGLGFEKIWDINKFKYEETVGYGLSDRSFLTQLEDKLRTLSQPFYLNAPTLSNHGPFDIAKMYRELDLPKEIDESKLGGYFESAHYTDKQVEMFLKKLEEQGILDNTVVVIYGDHGGVHKYYDEEIQKLSFEGDWWKEYDHKVPLIIYSKGITPKVFEASGGHTDIMPTVAYLLGIEDSKYRDSVMGRILVNTKRNATVIKGNILKGIVESESERVHLLKGYDIGSKIIKNRFFQNK